MRGSGPSPCLGVTLCYHPQIMLQTLGEDYESTRAAESSSPIYARSETTSWSDYVGVTGDYDERMLNSLNRGLDVVLVFVSTLNVDTIVVLIHLGRLDYSLQL